MNRGEPLTDKEQQEVINKVNDMTNRLTEAIEDKFESDPIEDYDDFTEPI